MREEKNDKIELIIKPERELFYSNDTNFGIYAVAIAKETEDSSKVKLNDYGNLTVKGSMPVLEYGRSYKVRVVAKEDRKFGLGYEIQSVYEMMPTSKDDQKKFLSAILTEKQVGNIFAVYPDDDVIELISEDKFEYEKVKGLGEVTYNKVKKKVMDNIEYREAIVKLSEQYGVTHNMIKKMSDAYGSPTLLVQKIQEDPYILAYDVDGIGFKKADTVALANGIKKDSPKRIGACINYILEQEANSGHTWVSRNKLSSQVAEELGLRMKNIQEFIDMLEVDSDTKLSSRIRVEDSLLALEKNYKAELNIASNIQRLLDVEDNYHITNIEAKIDEAEREQGFDFTEEQRDAILKAVKKNVIIINGKAGTGKTSVLKGVLKVLTGQQDLIYATCALSGKASQRIQESTGLDSFTIHRLLGFNPSGGFEFNEENKLPHDIIVLDEASMVNSTLMSYLIRAVKDGAKFIILGDTAQLEPIGVGNVLLDLINSDVVPRVELTIVHRQAQKSGILSVANGVREGVQFVGKNEYGKKRLGELKDLWLYSYKNAETVYNSVLELSSKYKGSILDYQIVVPLKSRGKLSTKNMNEELQKIFNPDEIGKPSIIRGKVTFRKGDKIIQNGNNYTTNVFNGTIGIIEFIDVATKVVVINFEGVGRVEYKDDELGQIDLAYALTVHRTQGSQWKHVVFAIDYSSYVLLSRQLVYTALTRASENCFLLCELNALHHSVRTDKSTKRNTFLQGMLK